MLYILPGWSCNIAGYPISVVRHNIFIGDETRDVFAYC